MYFILSTKMVDLLPFTMCLFLKEKATKHAVYEINTATRALKS